MQVTDFAPLATATSSNQVQAAGNLIERLKEILRSTLNALPPKAEILKIVGNAYDNYVAPLDIPGVPSLLEPWADQALKAIVLQLASAAYDEIASL